MVRKIIIFDSNFKIFFFSTIITIAHRLNTVLDYDRVLVLKDGNIAELDSPKQLMTVEGSIFRAMCLVRNDNHRNVHFLTKTLFSGCWATLNLSEHF